MKARKVILMSFISIIIINIAWGPQGNVELERSRATRQLLIIILVLIQIVNPIIKFDD